MTRVIKFMAHSDEGMVWSGQVREMDVGNDSAHGAAGFERRRVHERVIDAKRHVSGNYGTLVFDTRTRTGTERTFS